jgi:L-glyceraldehyde 3-phosphate reductase
MPFRYLGRSGLQVPRISLGLWHNFGSNADVDVCRSIVHRAFDLGVTCFDLANNYGPPPGHAEELFGRILGELPRDEVLIATKAGYEMWNGPYGNWGSRKHLIASLDQSLGRLGVDYVDIFYHHRPDPGTPLSETVLALDQLRASGKTLYTGISNYDAAQTREVAAVAAGLGVEGPIVDQCRHNLLQPGIDDDLVDVAAERGIGLVAFSPLAQGLLTGRYQRGIPPDSRAGGGSGFLTEEQVHSNASAVKRYAAVALELGLPLQELALAWVLRGDIASAIVGASSVDQVEQAVRASTRALDWDVIADVGGWGPPEGWSDWADAAR